uniref:ABC transmembrane type-1 domain-containing protein n=1 Tax=Steinernema glaseri TaxID=37863 RepID=A0A1I7YL86_9BILA
MRMPFEEFSPCLFIITCQRGWWPLARLLYDHNCCGWITRENRASSKMVSGAGPSPPARTTSVPQSQRKGWREDVAVFIAVILLIFVIASIICLGFYCYRDNALYEELVAFLYKTEEIVKINYNHMLGPFNLSDKYADIMGSLKTYQTILRAYFFSDLAMFALFAFVVIIYYLANVKSGTMHVIFWIVFALAVLYCIVQVHLFTFVLFPYSAQLSNNTEKVLNIAIPHNPGSIMQIENRFGCTFDYNLYQSFKRRENPKNTCDPLIEGSYISKAVLITILLTRLIPLLLGAMILAKKTPIGDLISSVFHKFQSGNVYKNKATGYKFESTTPKSTTFSPIKPGSDKPSADIPSLPPRGQLDHSISYNNAAFFATSGAAHQPGLNSTRSSDISRIDAMDLYKPSSANIHASNSIVSEV